MVQRMTSDREKTKKLHEIDHIPNCKQQPRSSGGPKRRTDFSTFFCSSSSSSLSTGPLGKGPKEMRQKRKHVLNFPIVSCSSFHDKQQGLLSNTDVPVTHVESFDQNSPLETLSPRTAHEEGSDIVRKLEFTPTNSQSEGTEGSNLNMSPGSVVWAKRAHQLWWPAEILGERSTAVDPKDQDVEGHVLIQYYGNHESVWVDPARHLSDFDENFEERSCHSGEEFQDALKQALWQKECGSSGKQCIGSSDYLICLNRQSKSPDKCNSSSSSRADSGCLERRRGKRERKPNLRFNQVSRPLKPVKKDRRLRIMRFLGLAAPVGSPF